VQVKQDIATLSSSLQNSSLPRAHESILKNDTPSMTSPSQALIEAKEASSRCKNLAELRDAVSQFHGLSIRKMAQNTVFADGCETAQIMVIGEAPGADEDRMGIPFCGASGQLLDQMLSCIGLFRAKNFYITNTIFWRPPGNRKPTPQELALCKPFVEKHIALIQPKLIILVGATAVTSVLESQKHISSVRGTYSEYTNTYMNSTIQTTALFHPSYLLRSPGQKKTAWQDLLSIDAYLTKHGIDR
jgi:DNA polymerase